MKTSVGDFHCLDWRICTQTSLVPKNGPMSLTGPLVRHQQVVETCAPADGCDGSRRQGPIYGEPVAGALVCENKLAWIPEGWTSADSWSRRECEYDPMKVPPQASPDPRAAPTLDDCAPQSVPRAPVTSDPDVLQPGDAAPARRVVPWTEAALWAGLIALGGLLGTRLRARRRRREPPPR